MACVKTVVTLARATVGPDVRHAHGTKPYLRNKALIVPSANEDPAKLSQIDQFLFENFGKDSPVIPVGVCLTLRLSFTLIVTMSCHDIVVFLPLTRIISTGVGVTAIILVSGLFSLQANNKPQQQMFMRMRVGAQGITVLAMMASLAVQERQKSLGLFKN